MWEGCSGRFGVLHWGLQDEALGAALGEKCTVRVMGLVAFRVPCGGRSGSWGALGAPHCRDSAMGVHG